MNNLDWLERMQTLSVQFAHLGIGADLAALVLIEAWGAYQVLCGVIYAKS